MRFISKLCALLKPPSPITTADGLRVFLQEQIARMSGEIVIKYAQKRLGKLHYTLAKTDKNYVKDLVDCQIKIHAQMLSDSMIMIAQLLKVNDLKEAPELVKMMDRVHITYIDSAPENYATKSALTEQLIYPESQKVGELAKKTGTLVFKTLPVTGGLLPSNAQIFQGQVRLLYINLLQKFGKRANLDLLAKELQLSI